MEIIGKIWKLTNIAKMGLTADQRPTAISHENHKTDVEIRQYHQNKSKWDPMSLSHENHNNVTEFSLLENSGLAKFTSAANCL